MNTLALIVLIAGIAIRLAAILKNKSFLNSHMGKPWWEVPSELITTGIYSYVRHPGYVGGLMIVTGLAVLCTPIAVILVAFSIMAQHAFEEERMIQQSGFDYESYKAQTGMFFPKIFKRRSTSCQSTSAR